MKKFILAALVALPLLGGCESFQLGQTSVAVASGQVSIEAEKALIIAHLAYNALGTQLIAAANSGVLTGSDAAQAKVIYSKAGDALKLADAADKAANEANLAAAIMQANALIAQAQALVVGVR